MYQKQGAGWIYVLNWKNKKQMYRILLLSLLLLDNKYAFTT